MVPSPVTMEIRTGETKQRRVNNVKTRTGCSTCKIRRVKCDERKPTCLRCEKFGCKCDGYPTPGRRLERNFQTGRHEIVPRLTSLGNYVPIMSVPGTEEERRYYQLFCNQTAADLHGYFPTDFWNRTVLQESHSETFIRHAVVALGALTKTYLEAQPLPATTALLSGGKGREHHAFALRQYNKAIVKLRHALSNNKVELRKALVACLLFVCFENYHGDYDAGTQHMRCGLGLLNQWRSQHLNSFPNGQPTVDHLACLVHDEVFQMFSRLDAQAFAHLGSERSLYPNAKLLLWETVGRKDFKVPAIFADIIEARKCWDVLMQRTVHFHKLLMLSTHDTNGNSNEFIEKEHNMCKSFLHQFEEAIFPLTTTEVESDVYSPSVGAKILYLSSKISSIFLDTCNRPGEVRYDMYNSRFVEIVSTIQPIVEKAEQMHFKHPRHFKFDLGTVLPLHLTAMKCRLPEIRRQAIALLLRTPAREGDWDGVMLAKVDAWLMNMEEENMNEKGFVPEHARWRLTKIDWNLQRRWIRAEFNQGAYDNDNGGQWLHVVRSKQAHITW